MGKLNNSVLFVQLVQNTEEATVLPTSQLFFFEKELYCRYAFCQFFVLFGEIKKSFF